MCINKAYSYVILVNDERVPSICVLTKLLSLSLSLIIHLLYSSSVLLRPILSLYAILLVINLSRVAVSLHAILVCIQFLLTG